MELGVGLGWLQFTDEWELLLCRFHIRIINNSLLRHYHLGQRVELLMQLLELITHLFSVLLEKFVLSLSKVLKHSFLRID